MYWIQIVFVLNVYKYETPFQVRLIYCSYFISGILYYTYLKRPHTKRKNTKKRNKRKKETKQKQNTKKKKPNKQKQK